MQVRSNDVPGNHDPFTIVGATPPSPRGLDLFINSAGRHGRQLDGGFYISNREGSITPAGIRAHLEGRLTLLGPVVADDGTCRFVVFDDDHAKHLPDTESERRRTRERAIELRAWLSSLLPESSIVTIESGGTGSHTFILLDRLPVEDVALVCRVLRALAAAHLGLNLVELETFPSSPSNPAKGEPCRYLRVPFGVHRGTGRWSRIAVPEGGGFAWRLYGDLSHLDVKPLTRDEFKPIVEFAREHAPQARRRTIADNRSRWAGDRPALGHDLAPIIEHCEVFRGCLTALKANRACSLEAVFVASIASRFDDGLDRILAFLGKIEGYAQLLLEKASDRQLEHDLPPFRCAVAEMSSLCPGPCAAAVAGNLRNAAELALIRDKKMFRKRVKSTHPTPLPVIRHHLKTSVIDDLRTHLPKPRIFVRIGSGESRYSRDDLLPA